MTKLVRLALVCLSVLFAGRALAGPIVSDFPNLPSEGPYCDLYDDLVGNGFEAPVADCNAISTADMLLHLQTLAGANLAAELLNDPTARGYAGHSYQEQSDMMGMEYVLDCTDNTGAFTGFTVSTSSVFSHGHTVWTTAFDFPGDTFVGVAADCYMKFDADTTTEALRGVVFSSGAKQVLSATSLKLPGLSASGADPSDVFHFINNAVGSARIGVVINGLAYAPNVMSAEDVQAALGE